MKISIIIPMYNDEKYIKQCLESIKVQTFKDTETIIINDGSTDRSLDIANEYINKIPNLKIISTENYGAGHARNIGLDIAKGEYIKFLDSDDELSNEDTLELLYNTATKYDTDVLIGKYNSHFGIISLNSFYSTLGQPKSGLIDLEQNKSYPFEEMPGIGDKFFKREFIGDLRFSEGKWEDVAFTPVLMASSNRLYFLNQTIYNYRWTVNNTSLNGCIFANNVFDFFKVYSELKQNFDKRGIKELYEKELMGLFSMHGHFDATYVPLWINMKITDKRDLLKLFISKLEKEYPEFRDDKITMNYYKSHKMFLQLFKLADNMAKKSNLQINTLDEDIKIFINKNKKLN